MTDRTEHEPPVDRDGLSDRPVHDPFFPGARPRRRRRDEGVTRWLRTGAVLGSAFVLWLVMDAAVLQHNATAISPLGARRTAALDVLGPIVAFANFTHLGFFEARANELLGRTGDGGFVVPTVPTTTTIPGTTTTTTTIPFHPTPKHKLRVLLVGDSIGEDLDLPLEEDLAQTGVVVYFAEDHESTGLVRPDYFPWVATLEYDVYKDHPNIIIGMIGANDDQGFLDGVQYGTAAWARQYDKVVSQFFTIGTSDGRKMFWVSVPTMQAPGWTEVRQVQHEAAIAHHVVYIDSNTVLCPGGTFHMFLRIDGSIQQIRSGDGVHLYPAGSSLLAQYVMTVVRHDLHLRLP